MIRHFATSLLLTIFAGLPAFASEPVSITITRQDCQRLVRHVPSADVAFKPGEGVHGRKVAPADLPGSGAEDLLPEVLEIPITINPVGYAQRITAQKTRADAATAVTANDAAIAAKQARQTALAAEKAALDARDTAYLAQYQAKRDQIIAGTGGATPSIAQTDVRTQQLENTRRRYLEMDTSYTALTAQRNAKAAEITANNAALATAQGNSASLRTSYGETEYAATAADAKWAALGLDSTTTTVSTVRYDVARNLFTVNGKPLGEPEQRDLAGGCRRARIR